MCHHIGDTCNISPVCYRVKLESIQCHCTCDSLRSNRRHCGYNTNRLHCNKLNGVVLSKFTKDLIAFSRLVSIHTTHEFIHFIPCSNKQLRYDFLFCRHSCDTDFNTSIYLRNRPATSAWRCNYSVLPNNNERTIHKLTTEANQCEKAESRIDFLHTISYMCH